MLGTAKTFQQQFASKRSIPSTAPRIARRKLDRPMKFTTFAVVSSLVLALLLFAQRRAPMPAERPLFSAVVDLTHDISEKSPNWEGTAKSPFEAKQLGRYEKEGYFSRSISLPEHFSTHVDAPAHFAQGRWTVDQIPPERLIAPLVVIDIKAQSRNNPDYQLTMDDVARWEQSNGRMPAGAVVMANTGWSAKWNSMASYRGADEKGTMHFPGFSLDAVKFLVQARNAFGLGIDTMGVDYGRSSTFPIHHYTSSMNVYHVENVADLDRVPEAGAIVVVGAAKLKGGSGGPVRVMALIREPGQ